MAWGNYVLDKGWRASAALVKYRACKFGALSSDNEETVTPVTANTDDPIGWPQYAVTSAEILRGKDASVRIAGVTEAEANGAIAIGKYCTLESDGTVSQLVGSSGKKVVGFCVGSPSTNAGDRIAMLIVKTNAVA